MFGVDCWDVFARENREVKNCYGIEEGSVKAHCKDDFVKKQGKNQVKVN